MSKFAAKIVRTSGMTTAQKSHLIMIGQRMSNLLYNMKQSKEIPQDWRNNAQELQEEWDEVRTPQGGQEGKKP